MGNCVCYLGRGSNNPNILFLVYNMHSLHTVEITKDMKIMPRVFFIFFLNQRYWNGYWKMLQLMYRMLQIWWKNIFIDTHLSRRGPSRDLHHAASIPCMLHPIRWKCLWLKQIHLPPMYVCYRCENGRQKWWFLRKCCGVGACTNSIYLLL